MAGAGIFCLEGDWGSLTDRTSVRLGLDMLMTVRGDRLIHRNAATREEFQYYFSTWAASRYQGFPLAYFAYHGSPGRLHLGRDEMSLQDLAALPRRPLAERVLYFGSCGTLDVTSEELTEFVGATGARAIAGYTKSVDWAESAAFDFTLLPELLDSIDMRRLFSRLAKRHPWFVDGLGLRVATRSWASPTARDLAEARAHGVKES